MIGEHRNCIPAHSATSTPFHTPAEAFDPANSSISVGSTGMTMPIAITSSMAVTRMNATAGRWWRAIIPPRLACAISRCHRAG